MNRIKTFAVAMLFLLFAALAWAQEPREESKPQQEPTKQEEARPEPKHEAAPPSHQNEMKPPQQEEGKPPKSERQESAKPPRDEAKPAHEQHGQEPAKGQAAQAGGHARPSGKSVHIPDQKFKANFGRQHTLKVNRVITQTTIVAGQTQFVYSGYTFVILDPWPAEWLFTDDIYIDYVDDDYFLFDLLHPGVRIALFVQG
jgi:outer membrane biosynthesis protein TonB